MYHALESEDATGDAADDGDVPKVPAILDLGHARSNLFVGRDGQAILARAITRGGQHLTAAIAETLGIDVHRAEQIKRGEARVVPVGSPPAGPVEARIDRALRAALAPLGREIRQTLASFRASTHLDVSALYVTGGAARLKGISAFLEEELGLPVLFLKVPNTLQGSSAAFRSFLRSTAMTRAAPWTGISTRSICNRRRASRAWRRNRAPSRWRRPSVWPPAAGAGRSICAVVLSFIAPAFRCCGRRARTSDCWPRRSCLRRPSTCSPRCRILAPNKRRWTCNSRRRRRSYLARRARTRRPSRSCCARASAKSWRRFPKATAYDLLEQISKKVPPANQIKLDITELEIRPKKTFIKGTVDSATAVDEIAEKLKEIDCYDEVTKGAVTEVSDGAKQFTLNVGSKCP